MSDDDFYDAHEPYLQAVADAIVAENIPVADVMVNADDPRNGWIVVGLGEAELTRTDEPVTYLLWHEERGWQRAVGLYGEQFDQVRDAPFEMLPTPVAVAAWCRRVLSGSAEEDPASSPSAVFRNTGDDDGFEEQLRGYR
ncbi:DUF6292 family protein [Actinosynnema sp. NPDC023587]|uniref:DUF6292 family protein n=1 Tax=Actinosynnema sp. NPDC023587 TaxID=3154695 RepID=UPI0033D60CC5